MKTITKIWMGVFFISAIHFIISMNYPSLLNMVLTIVNVMLALILWMGDVWSGEE